MNDSGRNERYLTACHEAGHAVACLLRGGEVDSISVEPTARHDGITHCRGSDFAFRTYAGPWAEARAQWPNPTLDGCDEDGCTFDDYVTRVFSTNTSDSDFFQYQLEMDGPLQPVLDAVWRQIRPNESGGDLSPRGIVARQETWDSELEHAWPVIQRVAERLLSGAVTGHIIRAYSTTNAGVVRKTDETRNTVRIISRADSRRATNTPPLV